jgi:hypothetical protein
VSESQRTQPQADAFGMLVWSMPVRVVDVSRSGCRVEIDRHLQTGTNGQLQLPMNGVVHVDDVRVCRCQQREGAGRVYHVGVELLRTRRLSRRSLRLAIRRIIGERRGPFADVEDDMAPSAATEARQARRKRGERSPPAPVAIET